MSAGQLSQRAYELAIDPRASAAERQAAATLAAIAYQARLERARQERAADDMYPEPCGELAA